jgi:glucosyl-dolichyl phosphate glucuronosyltransferase
MRLETDDFFNGADIVVIFATFNGAKWIEQVLEGYARELGSEVSWRLLIVDNGSTDETVEIIRRYADILPLKQIHEEKPGKNAALNTALKNVTNCSANFIFSDDDAIPESGFFTAWHEQFEIKSDHDLFGGTVIPDFSGLDIYSIEKYEKWFPEVYAQNIRASGLIDASEIFGPNMGVRNRVFRSGIQFDENIGPSHVDRNYPMGSETEFSVRASETLGLSSWFVANASVRHITRPHQAQERYILERATRHGRGVALKMKLRNQEPKNGWYLHLKHHILRAIRMFGSAHFRWNYAWLSGFLSELNRSLTKN